MRFEGKSVVVTGASSGMGRQIAYDFAKEGATVVAVARRQERLAELAAQVEADGLPGKILPFVGDVSSRETNDAMIDFAVEQTGEPVLDGRHRALSSDTLAIDDLARAAGTQAVEE